MALLSLVRGFKRSLSTEVGNLVGARLRSKDRLVVCDLLLAVSDPKVAVDSEAAAIGSRKLSTNINGERLSFSLSIHQTYSQ